LRAFDMIALSSRTEGTPVVLLEAMAAAVPIVATCVGGIPDVVDESQATLVAPNDPGALARALHGVLEDANGATARAERASQRLAAQYAVEPWLGAYDRVYEHVAAGERRLSA
jgi:glycosyltransferase involved in cell wall biosynthesis